MKHNAAMVKQTRELIEGIIYLIPTLSFTLTSFQTLTLLSTTSLLFISQHISLLLSYLQDPRKPVKYLIICSIRRIIQSASHMIDIHSFPFPSFLSIIRQYSNPRLTIQTLLLFRCFFVYFPSLLNDAQFCGDVSSICEGLMFDDSVSSISPSVSLLATEVLSLLSSSSDIYDHISSIFLILTNLLQSSTTSQQQVTVDFFLF